ncbi:hypothetical protein [Clostridium sp. Marseille-QA1073]
MKYYLVALFDESSSSGITELQRSISKRYRLYKNTPVLHIPLGVVNNNDIDKLDGVLTKMLSPYKKFKIGINNNIIFNEDSNMVGLKVEDKGYINRISRKLFDTLSLYGINIKEYNGSTFNIPISNANHSIRKASMNGNLCIDNKKSKEDFYKFIKINRFEIWKQMNNNKDIVKSYPLKDF